MNNSNDRQWLQYIETLRQKSQPVKIDALLQQRMQAFIKARKASESIDRQARGGLLAQGSTAKALCPNHKEQAAWPALSISWDIIVKKSIEHKQNTLYLYPHAAIMAIWYKFIYLFTYE